MNQASHYIDLLDWLIGPVKSLSASIATLGRNIEVEDTAAIQLVGKWRIRNNGSYNADLPKNLEGSITILEKGTVKIGGKAVNKIEYKFSDFHDDLLVEKLVIQLQFMDLDINLIMKIC